MVKYIHSILKASILMEMANGIFSKFKKSQKILYCFHYYLSLLQRYPIEQEKSWVILICKKKKKKVKIPPENE